MSLNFFIVVILGVFLISLVVGLSHDRDKKIKALLVAFSLTALVSLAISLLSGTGEPTAMYTAKNIPLPDEHPIYKWAITFVLASLWLITLLVFGIVSIVSGSARATHRAFSVSADYLRKRSVEKPDRPFERKSNPRRYEDEVITYVPEKEQKKDWWKQVWFMVVVRVIAAAIVAALLWAWLGCTKKLRREGR